MEALNAQLLNYILIALILGFIVGTLFWWITGRNKHVETHHQTRR